MIMADNLYIKTVKDVRDCIGQRVYWDDISARWVFLQSGMLEDSSGGQVLIDGDRKTRSSLKYFRNFEEGGK